MPHTVKEKRLFPQKTAALHVRNAVGPHYNNRSLGKIISRPAAFAPLVKIFAPVKRNNILTVIQKGIWPYKKSTPNHGKNTNVIAGRQKVKLPQDKRGKKLVYKKNCAKKRNIIKKKNTSMSITIIPLKTP